MVAFWQLRALGLSPDAIQHRVDTGRLHRIYVGVYAVGRPELSPLGRFMAAVLACGDTAALSDESAAVLWRIRALDTVTQIHVTVTGGGSRSHADIVVHRRKRANITSHKGIPVATAVDTLIDLAADADEAQIERDIDQAAVLRIATVSQIHRAAVEACARPGAARIRKLIERRTLVLATTELERLFVPIARRAGVPNPQTQVRVNGYKVDFFWPDLELVVETDGGNFHKTPGQQTRDRRRDQKHFSAGVLPLRFTHAQVKFEPKYVEETLRAVVARREKLD